MQGGGDGGGGSDILSLLGPLSGVLSGVSCNIPVISGYNFNQ
jgi:hypothetical protein